MEFLLKGDEDQDWFEVGDWFTSLVRFGQALGDSSSKTNSLPNKMALFVPMRPYAVSAICLGLSIQRFTSQIEKFVNITNSEISSLAAGTTLRLEWARRMVVGALVSYDSLKSTLILDINGSSEKCVISQAKSIQLSPVGFPEGIYMLEETSNGRPLGWSKQGAPAAMVFGDSSFFQTQIRTQISSVDLEPLFGTQDISLAEATRMDQLTPADLFPHFVNVFERSNNFPEQNSQAWQTVQNCSLCILDGNAATDELFDNFYLEDIPTLAILESGSSRMQEPALTTIKNSSGYLRPLQEEDVPFDWVPHKAVQLRSWVRA